MALIESLKLDLYRLPLDVVLSDSTHGSIPYFEFLTIRIRDTEGAEGVGYTYLVNSGGLACYALIESYLTSTLIGQDADRIEWLWQQMWWKVHHCGRGGHSVAAMAAVDIALWDLLSKRAGMPMWRFFGGYDASVPCYAGGVDLDFDIAQLLTQADQFIAQGFRAIKMKVGRPSLREDIDRVRRLREHLGDDFPLMVDANMRWTADEAVRAARSLEMFNLVWIEEPIIPDDVEGHVRVVSQGRTPVATGENMHTLFEFRTMIAAGGVTYPEPDVTNCGGISIFRKIGALAEAHNLPLTSHGAHDITVHLMAAAPNRSYLEIHAFPIDRYIVHPMKISEGRATAPERPGHGIEFIWDRLEHHRLQ